MAKTRFVVLTAVGIALCMSTQSVAQEAPDFNLVQELAKTYCTQAMLKSVAEDPLTALYPVTGEDNSFSYMTKMDYVGYGSEQCKEPLAAFMSDLPAVKQVLLAGQTST